MSARKEISSDQYGSTESLNENSQNAFKSVFKKYKKRSPPPDFSEVIDVTSLAKKMKFEKLVTQEDRKISETLGLIDQSEWKCYSFPDRPGLYVLPGLLKPEVTTQWLRWSFEYARPPNTTNLTAHGSESSGHQLRWTTLGVEYDWNTKEYPETGNELPSELGQLANLISRSLNLGDMRPDAAIVNYYPPKSTLSPHVDRSERCLAPLISLSLGQSAVYLTGGTDLSSEPIPIWLRNGDVLVMHGEQRFVNHAIPCVTQGRLLDKLPEDSDEILERMKTSRVNITIRQVNP